MRAFGPLMLKSCRVNFALVLIFSDKPASGIVCVEMSPIILYHVLLRLYTGSDTVSICLGAV
jgi:hypothetical protein